MKSKINYLLLPLIIISVAGCSNKKGEDNQKKRIFEEAENLAFDSSYKEQLTLMEDLDANEMYSNGIDHFYTNPRESQVVDLEYDCSFYELDNEYISIAQYSSSQYYQQGLIKSRYESETTFGNQVNENTTVYNDKYAYNTFYNYDHKAIVTLYEFERGNDITLTSYADKEDEDIRSAILGCYDSTTLDCFSHVGIGSVYKDKDNNYVIYQERNEVSSQKYGQPEVDLKETEDEQSIIVIDEDGNFKRITYFFERKNDLGINNLITKELNTVYKKQIVLVFDNNERESGSKIISDIESQYQGSYINDGYMYVGDCETTYFDNCIVSLTSSKTMKAQVAVTFDEMLEETASMSLVGYFDAIDGLYTGNKLESQYFEPTFEVKDKTGAITKGDGNYINYKMSTLDEGLLFTADVRLEDDNTAKVEKAFVELKTIKDLKEMGFSVA